MPDADTAAVISAVASAVSAFASAITAGAVWLQFQMWKEAKRQNDLQSKPRLRLKEHRSSNVSKDAENINKDSSISVYISRQIRNSVNSNIVLSDYYDVEAEAEWRPHVQIKGNHAALPNEEIGFLVENISPTMALGFTIVVEITVSGNPLDPNVKAKTYKRTHKIVCDVTSRNQVFIPLLHCRYIFGASISAKIIAAVDPSGIENIYPEKNQPSQSLLFRNDDLIKAVTPSPPAIPSAFNE